MKKTKRILPLLASITLLSAPVMLVVACDHSITRYPATLSRDEQNRILFDFNGVNYSVDAKSQFNKIYSQAMNYITKEVQAVMAHQEFYNFFTKKLKYSEKEANDTFETIKDNLGLNLLANEYFNAVNNGQNFDSEVYKTKLIFQTENWHLFGTTKFDYSKSDFYSLDENNPDLIFTSQYLYNDLYNKDKDDQIKKVAKYADENYNDEINKLIENNPTWTSPTGTEQLPPSLLGDNFDAIKEYQKKLERFKWWLRFRYQQYYYSTILPQLNETLFTMANILDSILKISDSGGKTKIQIDNSNFAIQLQDWGTNTTWTSKYRLVWDYTTSKNDASSINSKWATEPLPDLMNDDELNPEFLTQLASNEKNLKNTVDPLFGFNAFVNDSSTKDYASVVKNYNTSTWVDNTDGTHYWGKGNKKAIFAYTAPIYWIDVVQNLNFNFYKNQAGTALVVNTDEDYNGLISSWNNTENSHTSSSLFSSFIRSDNSKVTDNYTQNNKWNIFWQMLYFLSSQADTNPNKAVAKENFDVAAKKFFPIYIPKNQIYNDEFWNAVSSYYP